MTDPQPHAPEPCDHHWKSYLQPKNVGLSWIRQCSQCGDFDTDNLREQVAAAEQRGAEEGWDQCRDSIITAGRDHTEYSSNALDPGLTLTAFLDYTEKALANPYRADQMEGDDE